ncbi:DUF2306 domain-containing protein [Paenibacillus sp. 481]|uniref:DUF2306 domain-containing protein n=1 Tax=Paenibacillus sp. 481 TaxID=2835869 RepID=UPI001E50085F|nr:DUF2306 domain-containing protein [Paenibacillus sp. 481]UHA73245.1 DUF2306 domain-containing protein [Paenibacillus sp. 481]
MKKTSWFSCMLVFVISLMWVLHTFSKNVIVDPNLTAFLSTKTTPIDAQPWLLAVKIHIALAMISMLTGPFGFVTRIRTQRPHIHRLIGKMYVLSILLNGIPSFYLAAYATGGWVSTAGFICLNAVWLYATFKAYFTIKNRQVEAHRRWMIRSFAITLANLELYVLKTIFKSGLDMNADLAYTIAVWASIAVSLFIAELVILTSRSTLKKR